MARLIDADKIEYRADDSRMKPFDYVYRCDVEAEPTVDAVPIEFIRSEIKNSKGFYNSSLRRLLDAWEERKEE